MNGGFHGFDDEHIHKDIAGTLYIDHYLVGANELELHIGRTGNGKLEPLVWFAS